jgi:hypothetical protein
MIGSNRARKGCNPLATHTAAPRPRPWLDLSGDRHYNAIGEKLHGKKLEAKARHENDDLSRGMLPTVAALDLRVELRRTDQITPKLTSWLTLVHSTTPSGPWQSRRRHECMSALRIGLAK